MREEERTLRSGRAFVDDAASSAMEICQPSPTEYAPTAHAAAIPPHCAAVRVVDEGATLVCTLTNVFHVDTKIIYLRIRRTLFARK